MSEQVSGKSLDDQALEDLYEDIAVVTGMPFPNLVYRRLGEDPVRLRACWIRVREGLEAVSVDTLRASVLEPSLTALPPLRLGQSMTARQVWSVRSVLDAYDSGNACNAVAVKLLLHGSPGDPDSVLVTPTARRPTSRGIDLPPMLTLSSMTPVARGEVLRLSAVFNPAGDIVPSVLRHLAHDPELLASLAETIERAERSGLLRAAVRLVQDAVTATVAAWPVPVERVRDPSVRAVLEPFDTTIPRMLAVSAILRADRDEPRSVGEK